MQNPLLLATSHSNSKGYMLFPKLSRFGFVFPKHPQNTPQAESDETPRRRFRVAIGFVFQNEPKSFFINSPSQLICILTLTQEKASQRIGFVSQKRIWAPSPPHDIGMTVANGVVGTAGPAVRACPQ